MPFTIVGRNACKPTISIVGVWCWHNIKNIKMDHLVYTYAGVWWISAVHSQHGPGISCSLEAMKARKLRRRLDKMARDRGRLYTGREKLRGKRDEKSYSNYLTAALCPLKQLCSNRSQLELLSYSYEYRHAYVSPARNKYWPSCWTGTRL